MAKKSSKTKTCLKICAKKRCDDYIRRWFIQIEQLGHIRSIGISALIIAFVKGLDLPTGNADISSDDTENLFDSSEEQYFDNEQGKKRKADHISEFSVSITSEAANDLIKQFREKGYNISKIVKQQILDGTSEADLETCFKKARKIVFDADNAFLKNINTEKKSVENPSDQKTSPKQEDSKPKKEKNPLLSFI